jgi:hypothetical protein
MFFNQYLRTASILMVWLIAASCFADPIGYIKQANGKVQLYKLDEFKPQVVDVDNLPTAIHAGDKVRTRGDGDAVIHLEDGSTVMLTPRSIIIFHLQKDHYIEEGKILYDVRKQGGATGLIVATKSATIGVKGTQFMVKAADGQQSIYLKRGLISVDANGDAFKRSLADELSQFERYSQEQKSGFEQYKQKLQKEYVEYVQSISMNAGQAIHINNDKSLTEIEFTAQDENDFSQLDQWSQR